MRQNCTAVVGDQNKEYRGKKDIIHVRVEGGGVTKAWKWNDNKQEQILNDILDIYCVCLHCSHRVQYTICQFAYI